ncbi:hypothetical protein HPCPY1124_0952 [Helicobacter pylori CPY1124]|nr:hypothetical protein HPCPY1124_0952 [Helicobacter pylori CPY1124]
MDTEREPNPTTLIFQPTLISSTIKGLNGACFHVLIIP